MDAARLGENLCSQVMRSQLIFETMLDQEARFQQIAQLVKTDGGMLSD
jgi:hypothetical protein